MGSIGRVSNGSVYAMSTSCGSLIRVYAYTNAILLMMQHTIRSALIAVSYL